MLLDPTFVPTKVVDLDTADDYVEFIKISNANMLASENEFNTDMVTNFIPELLAQRNI